MKGNNGFICRAINYRLFLLRLLDLFRKNIYRLDYLAGLVMWGAIQIVLSNLSFSCIAHLILFEVYLTYAVCVTFFCARNIFSTHRRNLHENFRHV